MQAFGGFGRPLSKDDELAELKNQADYIKGDLEAIQGRIQELEGK
jgi:prefoldin subunit 5